MTPEARARYAANMLRKGGPENVKNTEMPIKAPTPPYLQSERRVVKLW
jgi:hypothetical protein